MILSRFIERTNLWIDNKSFRYDVVKRPLYDDTINLNDRLIDIFIGARRVEKTNIMYSIINTLLDKKINPRKILYISGEARIVEKYGLDEFINQYIKLHNFTYQDKLYIFIDEV